ncbi:uncharacterized protein LOC143035073 isoform X5 [Oratosquilla oratoria]|uniref:uncharacterized protein LOC143035073 isoform X5 n=1 Tax=Oratosquilla oratoria TaxID=337810 RepID=UPI003F75822E
MLKGLSHLRSSSCRKAMVPMVALFSSCQAGDGGIMNEEEFLLKWNNHQTNFVDVFRELLGQSSFIDVSLVCGGEVFPAHKVILAACSPLLHNLFKENPCQHPVVILNDVPARDMKAMMKFIYQGEVSVSQTELASFLKTADNLQIKGLAEDREKDREREERKRKEKDSDAKSEGRVNKRQRTSDHNSNRELASAQSNKAHKESYSSHNKNKSSSRNTSEDRLCNSIAQYGIQPSVGIRTIPPPHPTHPPTGNENDSSSANSQSVPPTSQAHSIPPKEETLMIKTEPFLDYHGEMVWQEGSEELDGNTQGPETINASEGLPLTDGHADSQVPAGMQEGQEGMPAPEMGEGGKYAEDMRGDANANNNDDPSHTAPATDAATGKTEETWIEEVLTSALPPSALAPHDFPPLPAHLLDDSHIPLLHPPPPPALTTAPTATTAASATHGRRMGMGRGGMGRPSGLALQRAGRPPTQTATVCPECGRVFQDAYKLKRHRVIHTGARNFECPACPFRCNRRDNLMGHIKKQHAPNP